jgi:hypothetical protein
MPIDPLAPAPLATDTPAVFASKAFARLLTEDTFVTQANALESNVNAKEASCISQVALAVAQVGLSTTQAGNAATSATAAAASALVAGATIWVSGTTYAIGDCRFSPANLQTYRRKVGGAGVTDPSADAANWTRVVGGGVAVTVGGTANAGTTTLTSASAGLQTFAFTAQGQGVNLPDATTMIAGADLFVFKNLSGFWGWIKNNAGTIVALVAPYRTVTASLRDASTAAGIWTVDNGSMAGITAELSVAAVTGSFGTTKALALDANRTLVLFGQSSIYGVIYDQSTNTFGAATLVASGLYNGAAPNPNAWAVVPATTAGTALLVYANLSTQIGAVVIGTAGTVITANAAVTQATRNATQATDLQLIALGASFVVSYRATGDQNLVAMTTSATTTTFGAAANVVAGTGSYCAYAVAATASVVLAFYNVTGVNGFGCVPYTLSAGTTLTVGTPAFAGAGVQDYRPRVNALGTRWVSIGMDTTYAAANLWSLAGTVVTVTSVADIFTGTQATPASIDAMVCNGKVIASGTYSTAHAFNVLTDTAGTISKGTVWSFATLGASAGTPAAIGTAGTAAFFAAPASPSGFGGYLYKVDASTASPVVSVSDSGAANSTVVAPLSPSPTLPFGGGRDGAVLTSGLARIPIATKQGGGRPGLQVAALDGSCAIVPIEFYAAGTPGWKSDYESWCCSQNNTTGSPITVQRIQSAP